MDESFRSVLPYLRLQNQVPPWLGDFFIFLGLVVLPALVLLSLFRKHRLRRRTYELFLDHATERGLSQEQRRLLLDIARKNRTKQPLLLLSSLKAFDQHLGRYTGRLDLGDGKERERLAAELGDLRRALGFESPPPGQPLLTSRQIEAGQTLMVWPEKGGPEGFCPCTVVQRDEAAIVLVPLLKKDEAHFEILDTGERVKVRFWGADHAEYRFRTEVLPTDPGTTVFALRHAERLERIQKRDFFRLPVDFELVLYPAVEQALGEEMEPVEARALDLSGGGMAVLTRAAIPPDTYLVVDPHFRGEFPVAGLRCKVLKQTSTPHGHRLSLEFLDLSPRQEGEIIRHVYQHQLHRA